MSDVILETRDPAVKGVVRLTLNRPDRLNSLADDGDGAFFKALFSRLNNDDSVRAIILTGAGNGFSAGGNVKDMRARAKIFAGDADAIAEGYRTNVHEIVRAIRQCRVPIIAAVNGAAIGLGNDVAGLCDIRLASTQARFGASFVTIGLIAGDGGAWILPRHIGQARAAQMLFTGEIIDAQTAYDWGLVSEILAPDALLARAEQLAQKIASQPPLAVIETKRLLRAAQTSDFPQALEAAAKAQGILHLTDDHMEALDAFFEKRLGKYTGK